MNEFQNFGKQKKIQYLLNIKKRKKFSPGYLYVCPWFIVFLIFGLVPIIMSLVMSFMDWPTIGQATFIGFKNFTDLISDKDFISSLIITARFAIVSVPLGIITSLAIASVMISKIKGIGLYRTIYYLPAIVSGVAIGIIWKWILNQNNGLINNFLLVFGIHGPAWLNDPNWVLPSYILIGLWGAGAGMLTYIVALNDVPQDLYEAAKVQGAGKLTILFKITLPMIRPILYYNLIMGIIGAFQKFNDAYILGGAGGQGNFILLEIYNTAFKYYKMGYACAMSWVFVIIIMLITLFVIRFTDFWKYGNEQSEG